MNLLCDGRTCFMTHKEIDKIVTKVLKTYNYGLQTAIVQTLNILKNDMESYEMEDTCKEIFDIQRTVVAKCNKLVDDLKDISEDYVQVRLDALAYISKRGSALQRLSRTFSKTIIHYYKMNANLQPELLEKRESYIHENIDLFYDLIMAVVGNDEGYLPDIDTEPTSLIDVYDYNVNIFNEIVELGGIRQYVTNHISDIWTTSDEYINLFDSFISVMNSSNVIQMEALNALIAYDVNILSIDSDILLNKLDRYGVSCTESSGCYDVCVNPESINEFQLDTNTNNVIFLNIIKSNLRCIDSVLMNMAVEIFKSKDEPNIDVIKGHLNHLISGLIDAINNTLNNFPYMKLPVDLISEYGKVLDMIDDL